MPRTSTAHHRLVNAAGQCFYERGINGTSVQDVIDEAGVSRPTMYAHFESKDALLAAVLDQRHQQRMADLKRFETAAGSDARARLLALFDWLDEHYCDVATRGCGFLNVAAEQGGGATAQQAVADHKRWMWQHLTQLADEAGLREPDRIGRQLLLLLDGVSGHVLANAGASRQETSEVVGIARSAAEVLVNSASPKA